MVVVVVVVVHTNITRHVVHSNAERFVVMPSCPQGVQLPDSRRRRRREKNVAVASNIDSSPRLSSLRGLWSWSGVWCVDIIHSVTSGSSSSSSYQRWKQWKSVHLRIVSTSTRQSLFGLQLHVPPSTDSLHVKWLPRRRRSNNRKVALQLSPADH